MITQKLVFLSFVTNFFVTTSERKLGLRSGAHYPECAYLCTCNGHFTECAIFRQVWATGSCEEFNFRSP